MWGVRLWRYVTAGDVLDVKLYGPVEIYRRFEGTCYVLQDRCLILRIWRQHNPSKLRYISTRLYGFISQMTTFFTANLLCLYSWRAPVLFLTSCIGIPKSAPVCCWIICFYLWAKKWVFCIGISDSRSFLNSLSVNSIWYLWGDRSLL
jgi:hypothetical protein